LNKMKKILLAIDDDLSRQIYAQVLKEAGFEVFPLENEEKIFDFLKKQRFDLIILDLSLGNLRGFEILEKIKKETDTPVFLFSTFEREKDREKARESGVQDFIVAPRTTPAELVLKIRLFFKEIVRYQLKVDTEAEDLKRWARDLGFLPYFRCQNCQIPLEMLLVKEKEEKKNFFKVVFICPKCKDIYFEK
jgi:DNA-binding response OmpR family regulator